MQSTITFINNLTRYAGIVASWCAGLLVLVVIYDILMRYLFKLSTPWIMELEWHLFSILFLLGAAYTFQQDKHVRVDLFYSKLSPIEQARVNLFGNLFFLLPWCIFIVIYAFDYAHASYVIGESSPDPGGLPYRFIVKSFIVLGFTLLALQAISNSLQCLQILKASKIKDS